MVYSYCYFSRYCNVKKVLVDEKVKRINLDGLASYLNTNSKLLIMGQEQVFNFLKRNRNKWFTSKQIADGFKASYGSVSTNLTKLRLSEQIKYKNMKILSKIQERRWEFVYSQQPNSAK